MTQLKRIRIATRESKLALWQANHVAKQLEKLYPQIPVSLVPMTTEGDQRLDQALAKIGGKGLFLKELETALLNDNADIAVHSMKDVPSELPAGLEISTILQREDPADAFVSQRYASLVSLPAGAKVGTSSLRRQTQLINARPDLQLKDLRGNVITRLSKLDIGNYDAIILACAGLIRLDFQDRITQRLATPAWMSAVGQGAIGIEIKQHSDELQRLLKPLNCPSTSFAVKAERAMNRRLEGSCQSPIGAFAIQKKGHLELSGMVASQDGGQIIRSLVRGPLEDPQLLGEQLAMQLIDLGALTLLDVGH